MKETIKCSFISYKKANLEIREKVAFGQEELTEFLTFLKEREFSKEFFILSTCNRTEVYYLSESDLKDRFVRLISEFKNDASIVRDKDFFASETDPERTIHRLFEIANGIHSQVLGDLQIISQVKNAYALACKTNTVGAYLHRLLQTLFSCYKAVASETDIHAGTASVSYAAMEIVRDFLKKEKDKPVLVIGAGDFSREVIEQLKKRDIDNITITNRSADKAKQLSLKYDLKTVPFEEVEDLWYFDVVISCISSQEIIVKKEQFEINPAGHKLLIDLSVPRSIDPDLMMTTGIKLINMSQITEKNSSALLRRQKAIPEALKIIGTFYREFNEWELNIATRPVLSTLKNMIEDIRQQEVERLMKKNKSKPIEHELIDAITRSIINKIIKMPAVKLSQSGRERDYLSKALVQLFDLESHGHVFAKA